MNVHIKGCELGLYWLDEMESKHNAEGTMRAGLARYIKERREQLQKELAELKQKENGEEPRPKKRNIKR